MNISKHKAGGIVAIGTIQGVSNVAWTVSDSLNSLGGARIGFHSALAVLATLELLWGLDFYNHIVSVQHEEDDASILRSLELIVYKAPVIVGVATVQLLTNIGWSFADGTSHLGIIRVIGHVVLASLAIVEMNLSYDLWQRLRGYFRPASLVKGNG